MKKHFADFVTDDIIANGMKLVESGMGSEYFVNSTRPTYGNDEQYAHGLVKRDDWNLTVSWFLGFTHVYLVRGPECIKINVNKRQKAHHLALVKHHYLKLKEAKNAAKAASKARAEAGQWWP